MRRLLEVAFLTCLLGAMLLACSRAAPGADAATTPLAPASTVVISPTATPLATPTTTTITTPVAPTAEVTAQDAPLPLGQSGSWKLIFRDEFDGEEVDLEIWEPSWFGGEGLSLPVNSLEVGCYGASQVSVSDGTLKLQADTTTDENCMKRGDSPAPYISGLINTRENFTFTYGYMEARIFLPGRDGKIWNWPAWWSDGTGDWPQTGEIDVMEGLSPRVPCWHYHYEDSNGEHQSLGDCVYMDGTGWHTYAAHWEADKITYFYDGAEVSQVTTGIVDASHFLILNYGIRSDYGIDVPATMEVDYVRVWQR